MGLIDVWNTIIETGAKTGLNEAQFLSREWQSFTGSERRKNMITGQNYYKGKQDILQKRRLAIGEGGKMDEIAYLPNNRICYNRYSELVDQKTNYLFAKPFELRLEDESLSEVLDTYFNEDFQRTLKQLCIDALNCGVAYLHPYIDDNGQLNFKRFAPEQILPFFKDEQETDLQSFLRVYEVEVYEGTTKTTKNYAEYYTAEGVSYYEFDGYGNMVKQLDAAPYIEMDGKPYQWDTVPLVVFKYNMHSIPLITRVKSLQDSLNTLVSNYADNMQEDIRNTIFVIKNYDGQDLGEFRHNLSAYGAVKVRTMDGIGGDVSTLSVTVNAGNYESIISTLKRAIIECGHGFDSKDDRMSNNPNQMNIRSMYSDIDLDANGMEMEFQVALKNLLHFVESYLSITGSVDLSAAQFVFNRDTPVNEGETIQNCRNSVGILSQETIIKNHPWTVDTQEEMEKYKAEMQEQQEAMAAMLPDYTKGHEE